jgi:hypothetical protein
MIRRFLLAVLLLLSASSALADQYIIPFRPQPPPASGVAWGDAASDSLGNTANATSSTTIALTTTAALESGNIGVCVIGADETTTGTTDGTGNANFTSVTDSASNTWVEATEYCNMQTATTNNGACVAIYYTKATSTVNSGGTITATFLNSTTAKAISCWEFTGGTVSLTAGTTGAAYDATDPGALSVATGVNREHLFVRASACESGSTSTHTATATFQEFAYGTSQAGSGTGGMGVRGEYKIETAATSTTSDHTYTAQDCASAMIGLNSD